MKTTIHGAPVAALTRNLDLDFQRLARKPGAICGGCGKTFGTVRKPAGIVAVENGNGAGIVISQYLLCRPCNQTLKAHGADGLPALFRDAESVARLALTPSAGRA